MRCYGWKHGFATYPFYPQNCLFIVVVRNPLDWLKSFYAAPFEVDSSLRSMDFPDFLRSEWKGAYQPRRSNWRKVGYNVDRTDAIGEELQADRHPMTGARFENVIKMRSAKLQSHLSFLDRGLNAIVVRYEDFQEDREACLARTVSSFELNRAEEYVPVLESVGPSRRRDTKLEYTPEDISHIRSSLDLDIEARCGYTLDL